LTLDPAHPQHPRTGKAADHKRTTAMVLTPAQRAELLAGVGLFCGAGEDGRAAVAECPVRKNFRQDTGSPARARSRPGSS
jgi:hypothetical protein